MGLNSWITSMVGLIILVFTVFFLTPLVYFINDIVLPLGANAAVQGKLMWEMEMGFYFIGFSLLVLPFIIDNWKREETALEYLQ